ncbi:40S ribosomal protein S19-like protein, partial [Pyrenophora tritici-repentis]
DVLGHQANQIQAAQGISKTTICHVGAQLDLSKITAYTRSALLSLTFLVLHHCPDSPNSRPYSAFNANDYTDQDHHDDWSPRRRLGVSRLRKVHGTGKNRGMRPSHHYNGSGSVDRKAIQALAKLQILELDDNTGGRRITAQGQRDLDRIALTVAEAAADDDSSDA